MAERGTILVVSDDPTVRQTVSEFLEFASFIVRMVDDASALDVALRHERVDAVVLDAMMNGGTGLELLPVVKGIDPSLEVVVITEEAAGETVLTAISGGASSYLQRPVRLPALLNRVRAAIATRSFHRYTRHLVSTSKQEGTPLARHTASMESLLRFDRDLMSLMDYRRVLDAILHGLLDMTAADIAAVLLMRDPVASVTVLPRAGAAPPSQAGLLDALLEEWEAWGGHALDRENLLWYGVEREAPAAVGDGVTAPLMVQDALIGAVGTFMTGPAMFAPEAAALVPIIAGRAEIVVENAFMHEHDRILATTDALTGLVNRRAFREGITREFERARRLHMDKREAGELAIIMLDVDHFKNFNDTYGHQMGDRVLKMVGSVLLTEARRATDIAARYGGEEFVIVAPDTSLPNAGILAERVRKTLAATSIESPSGPLYITASFGVSCYPTCRATNVETLIEQSDEALYAAKHNGRNRVESAPVAEKPEQVLGTPAPQPT